MYPVLHFPWLANSSIYTVFWSSSGLVFCLTPDDEAVKRRPECGGVERWRTGRRRGRFRTAKLLSAAPEFLHCESGLHKDSVGRSGTTAALEDKKKPAQTSQEKNVTVLPHKLKHNKANICHRQLKRIRPFCGMGRCRK